MDWFVWILFAVAWAVGTPILAIVALVRTGSLREQNIRLGAEIAALRQRIEAGAVADSAPAAPPPPPLPAPLSSPLPAPATILPPMFVAEPSDEPAPLEPVEANLSPAVPPDSVSADAEPAAGWEQRLGARAFIWIGAVTLALSAIFLVRYSIEEGYLSPEVRVVLAALFGFALIGGAERLRQRDERVAQAMAAAGVAAVYGALFAAVALYDMIPRAAAGVGAGALTAFAIGLSLRHGILVAALAFVGGFASPAIIGAEEPNTPVLFGYLLAIAAGTLVVIRQRGWWLLGLGVLAGAGAWTLFWIMAGASGLVWVGLFLDAIAALFAWAAWRRLGEGENPPGEIMALVWTAFGVTGALLVAVVVDDHGQQAAGWLALALHGIGLLALGRWAPRVQYVAALPAILSLLTLELWWSSTSGLGSHWDSERFAWVVILFGGFYAAAAFALMWNAARPGFWAGLSVATALAHFLLSWGVLRNVATGTPWGLISVGLAVPFLVGAERLVRWRDSMRGDVEALGFLAAGVAFFIAIAIPLELSREWITVGYAIELAAVAFITAQLGLVAMRRVCWLLLAAVVVRFVLNPEVLKYPLGLTPILNWILWGYGLSIAALAVGAHYLRALRVDRLALATEASMALLCFVLVTLEVRSLFQPAAMDAPTSSFLERSLYVMVWGGFALGALWIASRRQDAVALWAWRLAGGLAAGTALLVQVLTANPVFEPADVGQLVIVNLLLPAYAVPAAMAALARRWTDADGSPAAGLIAEATASVLAFAYVSFEVRHFFDPGFDRGGLDAEGVELYAYSFVWLLFGVALLVLGFVRGVAALRHAGMALVCIVVGKVFLVDMADLHGLLRVLSFLGLGAALLGLGYGYRRYGLDQGNGKRA